MSQNQYYKKLQKVLKALVEHRIVREYTIVFSDKKILKHKKTMKKITTIVIVLTLLTATVAYAKAKYSYTILQDNQSTIINGGALAQDGLEVVRFTDGKANCYIIVTKVNGNKVNTSISCVK